MAPAAARFALARPPLFPARPSAASCVATTAPSPAAVTLRPSPAEVSRTVVELASSGTLSASASVEHGGGSWPFAVGARFVADARGAPALCLAGLPVDVSGPASFHVMFEQSKCRTPQCTLLGNLVKPTDELTLKKLCSRWEKKFGEQVDHNHLHLLSIEKVYHKEEFKEDGVWVVSADYTNAEPDPLREFAEKLVEEMNQKHPDDVQRLCSVYVDAELQVTGAKMVWVDRLGFDLYIHSDAGTFAARIPFLREVSDEKGVKSTFNSMSHLAWEIEKSYAAPDFERVKLLKLVK